MSKMIFAAAIICLGLLSLEAFAANVDTADLKKIASDGAVFIAITKEDSSHIKAQSGTAFLISDTGYAITAHHVINDWIHAPIPVRAKVPILARADGPQGKLLGNVSVVEVDELLDVALLKVDDAKGLMPLPVCFRASMVEGRAIYSAGFADGHSLAFTSGLFSNVGVDTPATGPNDPDKRTNPAQFWEVSTPFAHGMSGGPVFDEWGSVVAFVEGGIAESAVTKFVVSMQRIRALLERHVHISPHCGPTDEPLPDTADKLDPTVTTRITVEAPTTTLPFGFNLRLYGRGFHQQTGTLVADQLEWSGEDIATRAGDYLQTSSLALGSHRIYLKGTSDDGKSGLSVVTITIVKPDVELTEVASVTGVSCSSVALKGDLVALAVEPQQPGSWAYTQIYSILVNGELSPVSQIGGLRSAALSHALSFTDSNLLFTAADGIRIVSLSDPGNPRMAPTIPFPPGILGFSSFELSPSLLIARSFDAVTFFTLPYNGDVRIDYQGPGMDSGLGIIRGGVFLSRRWQDLLYFDPQTPAAKRTVAGTGADQLSTNLIPLQTPGDFAVASWSGKLDAFSMRVDGTVSLAGKISGIGNALRIERWNNIIFMAALSDGLTAVDIDNPHQPKLAFGSTTMGVVNDISVDGDRIAVCSETGLHLLSPHTIPK